MEYQFIRDPIDGFSLEINDEHKVIGQWLTTEIGTDKHKLMLVIANIEATNQYQQHVIPGTEYSLIIESGEAMVRANVSQIPVDPTLLLEQELQLDDTDMIAECGQLDLLDLLYQWQDFIS